MSHPFLWGFLNKVISSRSIKMVVKVWNVCISCKLCSLFCMNLLPREFKTCNSRDWVREFTFLYSLKVFLYTRNSWPLWVVVWLREIAFHLYAIKGTYNLYMKTLASPWVFSTYTIALSDEKNNSLCGTGFTTNELFSQGPCRSHPCPDFVQKRLLKTL